MIVLSIFWIPVLFRPCSAYLTLILLVLLVLLAIDKVVGEDTTQKKWDCTYCIYIDGNFHFKSSCFSLSLFYITPWLFYINYGETSSIINLFGQWSI